MGPYSYVWLKAQGSRPMIITSFVSLHFYVSYSIVVVVVVVVAVNRLNYFVLVVVVVVVVNS